MSARADLVAPLARGASGLLAAGKRTRRRLYRPAQAEHVLVVIRVLRTRYARTVSFAPVTLITTSEAS